MSGVKVFISGPMRGYENGNKEMFDRCEEALIRRGFSVFNPSWLQYDDTWERADLLEIDICALNKCQCICHLPGWQNASGCKIEHTYAVEVGKPELYFDGTDIFIVSKFIGKGAGMMKIQDIQSPVPSKHRCNVLTYLYDFEKITLYSKWLDEGIGFEEMAKRHFEKHHTRLSVETIKKQLERYGLINCEDKGDFS